MSKITTKQQLIDYCKLASGQPVINIEMTDQQMGQHIDDCVDLFCRYAYHEGTYMDYAVITFSAGVNELPLVSAWDSMRGQYITNVQDVYDFGLSFGFDGINTLFSPQHVLLYDSFVGQGNYPGGPGTGIGSIGLGTGLTLANYQISMNYIEQIKEMFGKMYTVSYLQGSEVLKISPTPNQNVTGALRFYRRETAENIYNNILFKFMLLGRIKQKWGEHLGKYAATLPDGITVNYDRMITEGKEEFEKYFEEIRKTAEPIDFFIG